MMLTTWLVEFYLSKCNELDDVIASRSVSEDVENLKVERMTLEEDLEQFFVTYKVRFMQLPSRPHPHNIIRTTWIRQRYTNWSKGMGEQTCIFTMLP
jgi:hypothetical protein